MRVIIFIFFWGTALVYGSQKTGVSREIAYGNMIGRKDETVGTSLSDVLMVLVWAMIIYYIIIKPLLNK